MKILRGFYKGTEITTPDGKNVRPTVDHFKKHLIKIAEDLKPKVVWDIFAGSGGVGLEFLSLGAEELVLVEQLRAAVSCIKLNVAECQFKNPEAISQQKVDVVMTSAEGFLKDPKLFSVTRSPDLIFMDPPYGEGWMAKVPDLLFKCPLVSKNTIMVAEHVVDDPLSNIAPLGTLVTQSHFGPKVLSIFKLKP